MMRIVLDTNTLISAHFWFGPPRQALQAALEGKFRLVATEATIAELAEVLSRPKFAPRLAAAQTTADELLADYRVLVEIVEPAILPEPVSDDPDDDMILACAVGGNANYVITGDDDLLRLNEYQAIPIRTVPWLLEFLEAED